MYADVVLTAARYLIDKYRPEQTYMIADVSDMTIIRALVAQGKDPQLLRVSLDVDWPLGTMRCQFYSINVSQSMQPGSFLTKRDSIKRRNPKNMAIVYFNCGIRLKSWPRLKYKRHMQLRASAVFEMDFSKARRTGSIGP